MGLSCVPKPTFRHTAPTSPPLKHQNTKHFAFPRERGGAGALVIPAQEAADDASDWHIPSSGDPPATPLIPNLILMTARVRANKQGCAQTHAHGELRKAPAGYARGRHNTQMVETRQSSYRSKNDS